MTFKFKIVAGLICLMATNGWAAEPGEFSIPDVIPLNKSQLVRLRELVRTDSEARKIADSIRIQAEPFFGKIATPLKIIHYEGLVNTDPRRIATVAKLRQMTDAAILMRHWQASGDSRAAATLEQWITAWAKLYQPNGNNVNENKFHPILVAYEALRNDFSDENRKAVDQWVEKLGKLHEAAIRKKSNHLTNRYVKHLRLLSLAGRILDRPEWTQLALDGVKRFVNESLRPDGTSKDLEHRDSLGYHSSALRPPMELAILAGDGGRSLYSWTSKKGGSIKKSVDYMVPYALGRKVHHEWVNSKVDLDRRRAAAGIEKYQIGKPYDPKDALKVMELASYFDSGLMPVVLHLTESKSKRFPTWTTLTNTAARSPQLNEAD